MRLRAARILLVVYVHHVTSESRDVHIYARVVLPTHSTLSTSHTVVQVYHFVWERTFRGRVQGHDTLESRHEAWHLLTSHYIKTAHYRITRNHSHRTTSLIRRRVMAWRDAQGLVEQLGCYGRKLFYCSEPVLLNDDDDDEEETLGEYVQSTKQWKKIGNELRCREQDGSHGIDNWDVSPLILMDFSMTHSHMTNRHSFNSSNSGVWLNSYVNLFPLITYHFTWWVTSPLLLSSILTLMTPFPVLHHHFSMAALLCLLRLCIMTHFFNSHYSPCW